MTKICYFQNVHQTHATHQSGNNKWRTDN